MIMELLIDLHRQFIENSIHGLNIPPKQREYGFYIGPTTPEKFALFKKKLKKMYHKEVDQELGVSEGEATMLAIFSFQLYPIVSISEK